MLVRLAGVASGDKMKEVSWRRTGLMALSLRRRRHLGSHRRWHRAHPFWWGPCYCCFITSNLPRSTSCILGLKKIYCQLVALIERLLELVVPIWVNR
jgi:hypothetical protein